MQNSAELQVIRKPRSGTQFMKKRLILMRSVWFELGNIMHNNV
jgi:hypothetical protein